MESSIEASLPARVEQSIRSRGLITDGTVVLVAVSGGADSMVLLDILHQLADRHGWLLEAAHFNHGLRGRAGDADEKLVRKTCQHLGIKLTSERGEVREWARAKHISLEMAGRALRHEFLARTALEHGLRTVALAHHADDQVELFFLRLLRGAGSEGLAGMEWSNPSPMDGRITLVRPLLDCSKSELERYAALRKVLYRNDASNRQATFERNRIRRRLIPLLQAEFQPRLNDIVLRLMDMLRVETEFIQETVARWKPNDPEQVPFERLHPALQRQWLKTELIRLGIVPEYDAIETLRSAAEQAVTVAGGKRASRAADGSVRLLAEAEPAGFVEGECRVDVTKAGQTLFDGLRIEWVRVRVKGMKGVPGQKGVEEEVFDADKVGQTVILRHWRPGDRFQPIGAVVAAKLQDIFVNRKIPRERRRRLVLAETAAGEIFWVEGLRISETHKITDKTGCRLRWSWHREAV